MKHFCRFSTKRDSNPICGLNMCIKNQLSIPELKELIKPTSIIVEFLFFMESVNRSDKMKNEFIEEMKNLKVIVTNEEEETAQKVDTSSCNSHFEVFELFKEFVAAQNVKKSTFAKLETFSVMMDGSTVSYNLVGRIIDSYEEELNSLTKAEA